MVASVFHSQWQRIDTETHGLGSALRLIAEIPNVIKATLAFTEKQLLSTALTVGLLPANIQKGSANCIQGYYTPGWFQCPPLPLEPGSPTLGKTNPHSDLERQ